MLPLCTGGCVGGALTWEGPGLDVGCVRSLRLPVTCCLSLALSGSMGITPWAICRLSVSPPGPVRPSWPVAGAWGPWLHVASGKSLGLSCRIWKWKVEQLIDNFQLFAQPWFLKEKQMQGKTVSQISTRHYMSRGEPVAKYSGHCSDAAVHRREGRSLMPSVCGWAGGRATASVFTLAGEAARGTTEARRGRCLVRLLGGKGGTLGD